MPGTVLGAWNISVNKRVLPSRNWHFIGRRQMGNNKTLQTSKLHSMLKIVSANNKKSKPGQKGSEMCVCGGWVGQLQITVLGRVLRKGLTELVTF